MNLRFDAFSALVVSSAVAAACAKSSPAVPSGAQSGSGGTSPNGSATSGPGGNGGAGGQNAGPGASVLMHHNHPSRDGVFIDAALTKKSVAGLHMDKSFVAAYADNGSKVFAQPLYLDNASRGRDDLVIVATELNHVYAFRAKDGSVAWQVGPDMIGAPAPQDDLQCPGNKLPGLGITGTPVIDWNARRLYLGAMTDANATPAHKIFALDVDSGAVVSGWPVDVSAKIAGFNSKEQNERGALALVGGVLYVPYGGLDGDCGDYHGWVVAVPADKPQGATAWRAAAPSGPGIWAPGGVASDGASIFVATGNANWGSPPCGANAPDWSSGNTEAILRLSAGPAFSGASKDFYTPQNWFDLDCTDIDLGGSGPLLVDVPGANPSKLVVALGKDGNAYLLNRGNLGGIGAELKQAHVANNEIINAATGYHTQKGTYVALKGNCTMGNGDIVSIAIDASLGITTAWCATQNGKGSPFFSDDGSGAQGLVWGIGAEGSNRLYAFDADTGAVVFDGGKNPADQMTNISHFSTGIAAKGRIFVAADARLYAFTTN